MEQKIIYNYLISIKHEYTFAFETQKTIQEILRKKTLHTSEGQINPIDITSIVTMSARKEDEKHEI